MHPDLGEKSRGCTQTWQGRRERVAPRLEREVKGLHPDLTGKERSQGVAPRLDREGEKGLHPDLTGKERKGCTQT